MNTQATSSINSTTRTYIESWKWTAIVVSICGITIAAEAYLLWKCSLKNDALGNELTNCKHKCKALEEGIEKAKALREVERKGRISAQQRTREQIIKASDESGYRYNVIATIESPFPDRRGTPRQPLLVRSAKGKIRFNKQLVQHDHFKELEHFSHLWIIFVFHCNTNVDAKSLPAKIKPPRLGGAKVGCLSTRSPHRPNNIGLSVCEISQVGSDFIEVIGLDLVDGTPVLDIKPYIPIDTIPLDSSQLRGAYMQCLHARKLVVPSWIIDEDIKLRPVRIEHVAMSRIEELAFDGVFRSCSEPADAMTLITQVLHQDIRGVHQGRGRPAPIASQDDASNEREVYECRLDDALIKFRTLDEEIVVFDVIRAGKGGPQTEQAPILNISDDRLC